MSKGLRVKTRGEGERWQLSTIRIGSPGPPSPATCGAFPPRPAPKHRTGPSLLREPWPFGHPVLFHCSAQPSGPHHWHPSTSHQAPQPLTLTPLLPHPDLIVPPAPLRNTLLPADARKRILIRECSPLQSSLHTHRPSVFLGPLLQMFRPHLGAGSNNNHL